jgi:hypothetical protein
MTCRSELALYIFFDIALNILLRDINELLVFEYARNIFSVSAGEKQL